ncbi:MAG: hypothetical protein EHM81_04495 [Chloroflexi bacterium]|nr:MAG: hypothetical protein EHM81_04495 [Chloroflexota bacterium]
MRYRIISLFCCGLFFLTSCAPVNPVSPTPADPPKPSPVTVINLVQGYLNTMDPVGVILDARFQVIDVVYEENANNKEIGITISINCEGLCSRERSFSALMMAFIGVKDKLPGVFPTTLKTFKVLTFKQLAATGEVTAKWQDIVDYLAGTITGAQLATRVTRP